MLSLILKFLMSAMSKFVRAGLRRKFLPALPKVKPRGAAKAPGLNRKGATCGPGVCAGMLALGSPITSGNEPLPVPLPTPALSENTPLNTVNGDPDETVVMPDHCHPPRNVRTKP